MAARPTMRLWTTHEDFQQTCDLTQKLPDRPAAVPIFARGRTRMLVFDLDAKTLGAAAVVRDARLILRWINDCGGLAVVDESTSGGMHVLVPLNRAVTVEDARPLLAAIAARCPTVDVAPMLNAKTGCITVPGSPCREGGYRRLKGSVDAATHAFTQRSDKHFFTAINALLATNHLPAPERSDRLVPAPGIAEAFDGQDVHTQTLRAVHLNQEPLPPAVERFARTGAMPVDGRWPTRSEARQSVLAHTMWRGASLSELEDAIAGPWSNGLGTAYRRYGSRAKRMLRRDWISAQRWLTTRLSNFHSATHKKQHNGATTGTPLHARWLAHAIWWCDLTLRAHPQRWAVATVLQALAVSAARAGEVINGVAVVAVGGRSLSIAAGLLSESTVWAVLRILRDMPGAPVVLVAQGTGLVADRYALTTPSIVDPAPAGPGRPEVAEVHPAWAVLGYQHRRVYEVITRTGVRTVREVSTAARTSLSATYDSIAELARCGLIVRTHGSVSAGSTTLDDIAERYRLDEERAQRIDQHRHERDQWRRWLGGRQDPGPWHHTPTAHASRVVHVLDAAEELAYQNSVMATGPPRDFDWAV
ncbi:hypothetical protein [Mycobacterium intracellulare]|uniref:hypothetical protein n=1 Tax=Mycobacterium intracellulare TaxID=1767 RepID=UPI001EEE2C9E|nr:hypothetical protein [Mycobacterium intracellulare]MEE3755228.1 hypothetical protein [Mycobacterium intracellulare]